MEKGIIDKEQKRNTTHITHRGFIYITKTKCSYKCMRKDKQQKKSEQWMEKAIFREET